MEQPDFAGQRPGSGFLCCSLFGREHLSPGCVDLMRHSAVRLYTRPQELRSLKALTGLE